MNRKTGKLRISTINKSFETIELALLLIDRIRNSYITEESRLYLAENEKETYMSAIRIARKLFDLTGDDQVVVKMYGIAQRAKAAVLRDEIAGNELLYTSVITDSARKRQNRLAGNIAAYKNLIIDGIEESKTRQFQTLVMER